MEIRRAEFCDAGKYHNIENIRDNDYCITTREFINYIKTNKIDFESIKEEKFDDMFGRGSGAGVIFGATGGVAEAAIRACYFLINKTNPPKDLLKLVEMHTQKGVKTAEVSLGEKTLKVCIINGLSNAKPILEKVKNNELYFDFIEVMACSGGCSGGGGQPRMAMGAQDEVASKRVNSLLQADVIDEIHFSSLLFLLSEF